jgi:1-deoxy-D-xylulose-5-phosphate reductoisomerase
MVDAAARRQSDPSVDSEHNAIHQCLHGRRPENAPALVPTHRADCSTAERVGARVGPPEAALRHPTWQMGRKVTIDSAT